MHKQELGKITTLHEQLTLVSKESEGGSYMNAHDQFIDYELEFDLNNSYIHVEEEIMGMLDEGGGAVDNEPIERS